MLAGRRSTLRLEPAVPQPDGAGTGSESGMASGLKRHLMRIVVKENQWRASE